MKRAYRIILACMLLLPFFSVAQCASKRMIDSCSAFPKEYVFSKSRVVEIVSKKDLKSAIFGIILNKGTTYIITVCEGASNRNDGKMVVNLFDKSDNLVMSSHNDKTNKYYSKIIFNCNSSGTYYLGYLFNGGESKGCGVSALGFLKKK